MKKQAIFIKTNIQMKVNSKSPVKMTPLKSFHRAKYVYVHTTFIVKPQEKRQNGVVKLLPNWVGNFSFYLITILLSKRSKGVF